MLAAAGLTLLGTFQGCATLTPVDGSVCGDGVVGLDEECDKPNGGDAETGFCGEAGSDFACLRVTDAMGNCPPGLVPSNGRCLSPSGKFGPSQTLEDGLFVVGADDFDGDGQTDLLYQSASGLRVSYFDAGTPVDPPFSFEGLPLGGVYPSVDVNGDGARDLIIPNASNNALGVFTGTDQRSFVPAFQPSLSLGNAIRMLALPPGSFDPESRFLRRLGVFDKDGNLCVAASDGTCNPLPGADGIPEIDAGNILTAVVMDPLYIPETVLNPPSYRLLYSSGKQTLGFDRVISIQFAEDALPGIEFLSFPNGAPDSDASLACLAECALPNAEGGPCDCIPFDSLHVLALSKSHTDDDVQAIAFADVTAGVTRYLGVFVVGSEF